MPETATGHQSQPLTDSFLLLYGAGDVQRQSATLNEISPLSVADTRSLTSLISQLPSVHPMNVAVGAGVASGGPGIAGSFVVNVIDQTTDAYINSGDLINTFVGTAGYPTAQPDEGVTVSATETMNILDWAGAVGGGTNAGIGAALDVDIVTENAEASIASNATVDAAQNVEVTSSTNGTFQSITVAGGSASQQGSPARPRSRSCRRRPTRTSARPRRSTPRGTSW